MSAYILVTRQLSRKLFLYLCFGIFLFPSVSLAQSIGHITVNESNGLMATGLFLSDSSSVKLIADRPLVSFYLNGKYCSSGDSQVSRINGSYIQTINTLKIKYTLPISSGDIFTGEILFENSGSDTIALSNVVPFGESKTSVYITGSGPDSPQNSFIYRPGFSPSGIILPENAQESGYSSFETENNLSVCALARRSKADGSSIKKNVTLLPPGSSVNYLLYADMFKGDWQTGLTLMFRDRYLFDLENFDNTIYERDDLSWIRKSYLMIFQMAWDREFYDRKTNKYTYPELLKKGIQNFGNIDVFGLWPAWPRIGLDQRTQRELYNDLPGGTTQLRNFSGLSRKYKTRFFLAYNPSDNSLNREDHYRDIKSLINETDASGIFIKNGGGQYHELQTVADAVKKDVVIYPEEMPVIKDMQYIPAGRITDDIYLSPELNLNKFIKPDFAIFRVCDIGEDIIHREIAVSFFNGYGTELNMFRPGRRDENYDADLEFLAGTTFILRQNSDAFLDLNWIPLIETNTDSVLVNRWNAGEKRIYTVLNMKPEGINGNLIKIVPDDKKHYVSLWNHEEIIPQNLNGKMYLTANALGWKPDISNRRMEASVDCIAEFPQLLRSSVEGDSIKISSSGKRKIIIWKGNPSYKTSFREVKPQNDTVICTKTLFGYYEGKIVLQLIEGEILKDENIIMLKGGKPWIVSNVIPTTRAASAPADMLLVPGLNFSFNVIPAEDFIPYPDVNGISFKTDSFLIDKYPVTNAQYFEFLINTGYMPGDTTRYLRHWEAGMYKQGQDRYPVVYISYEDAAAYARWAEKRLPTEVEWQLAAQGTDNRKWPWGNEFHATYCNNSFERPTPVDAFAKGESPYGVMDLVGNVWQMTNDMYFNGTNYFLIIRGGSYYKPVSDGWYMPGGPQSLDKTQMLLLVSPGFDRSPTVGFRCVKDISGGNFKGRREK